MDDNSRAPTGSTDTACRGMLACVSAVLRVHLPSGECRQVPVIRRSTPFGRLGAHRKLGLRTKLADTTSSAVALLPGIDSIDTSPTTDLQSETFGLCVCPKGRLGRADRVSIEMTRVPPSGSSPVYIDDWLRM